MGIQGKGMVYTWLCEREMRLVAQPTYIHNNMTLHACSSVPCSTTGEGTRVQGSLWTRRILTLIQRRGSVELMRFLSSFWAKHFFRELQTKELDWCGHCPPRCFRNNRGHKRKCISIALISLQKGWDSSMSVCDEGYSLIITINNHNNGQTFSLNHEIACNLWEKKSSRQKSKKYKFI